MIFKPRRDRNKLAVKRRQSRYQQGRFALYQEFKIRMKWGRPSKLRRWWQDTL